jgi:hypothetical protein
MSKKSRTKGHSAERKIAQKIRESGLDKDAKRCLEYQQGMGRDIDLPNVRHFALQIKRHKRVARGLIDTALAEAQTACGDEYKVPVAVFRDDNDTWKVCLTFDDFIALAAERNRFRVILEKARKYVTGYAAGSEKNLAWFDTNFDTSGAIKHANAQEKNNNTG